MSYSDFKTLKDVKDKFDIKITSKGSLFSDTKAVEISQHLKDILAEDVDLALNINTEKARSELIISPVLLEARKLLQRKISYFSGLEFNVDEKLGLTGYCDFILSDSRDQVFLEAPVICVIEAKNENIKAAYGQCIAEMIAANIFNQRHKHPNNCILGVITTGSNWKFLQLKQNQVLVDYKEYLISQVGKIVAILVQSMKSH